MQSTTPAPQEPVLAQKPTQLAENLDKVDRVQPRCRTKVAPRAPSSGTTLEDHILEVTDDLLRVSAGLESFLTLLDLQCDTTTQGVGLHALLSPLKEQLDESVSRLQALV
ncbi:DUF1484 family protein [Cupriavidus alkaliphilus]|uniref:DUF1484 family protein n=1 Tax=Cupriavidus alkaliphilus TaxID=942866 RepID=UPI0008156EAD|nr:DUF1484 family protein [Cupriavidus alkaliphilus]SCB20952.1 Protein of unknown function [Cupriavidus alkaliphilus]